MACNLNINDSLQCLYFKRKPFLIILLIYVHSQKMAKSNYTTSYYFYDRSWPNYIKIAEKFFKSRVTIEIAKILIFVPKKYSCYFLLSKSRAWYVSKPMCWHAYHPYSFNHESLPKFFFLLEFFCEVFCKKCKTDFYKLSYIKSKRTPSSWIDIA
ncbi:hypothetical protein BpHYR1_007073 [Brachionus plicatilis]|uniref:Uncharacterized protein n=1 Tax=Brachionus plicatilis TaxID=10195 RepID=A0A3M7PL41_BRAPC|nr:hypothetical protein BpHYR1_007073 [Brachionus plicatilis]